MRTARGPFSSRAVPAAFRPAAGARRKKVLLVFGTRPEAIKQAPVLFALRARGLRAVTCAVSQHGGMLADALSSFALRPDYDLGIMRPGQRPADVLARALAALAPVLRREAPDLVLVQGDTTSALAAALASRNAGIACAHVEAGLRSGDPKNPYPEEINRVLIDRLCALHFAPTLSARRNLRREGFRGSVFMTGNTVVDALRRALRRTRRPSALRAMDPRTRLVLVTLHRRESFGPTLRRIFGALRELARRHEDCLWVYPMHPNPEVRRHAALLRHPRLRVLPPLPYPEFLWLMRRASLILTDSGGVQEEAPCLGKPVLVLRRKTERPELLKAGRGILVGTDPGRILREASRLLSDPGARRRMGRAKSLFGDGKAASRIAAGVAHFFGQGPRPGDWKGP